MPPQPHQADRGCWCSPRFAIDTRGTLANDDIRVFVHRNPGAEEPEEVLALRARKGVVVEA